MTEDDGSSDCLSVIYDGECPFCSRYVSLYRLRSNVKQVRLIDARENRSLVESYRARGYEINDGMLVLWGGAVYHGARAMQVLAQLSSERGTFNTINKWIFGSPKLGEYAYPIFVRLRKIALKLLNKSELKSLS